MISHFFFRIFDVSLNNEVESFNKEIRFPMGTGLAGLVGFNMTMKIKTNFSTKKSISYGLTK